MADNYLAIKCKVCKKFIRFGKFYPTNDGWYLSTQDGHKLDVSMAKFLESHWNCYGKLKDEELFTICYDGEY